MCAFRIDVASIFSEQVHADATTENGACYHQLSSSRFGGRCDHMHMCRHVHSKGREEPTYSQNNQSVR